MDYIETLWGQIVDVVGIVFEPLYSWRTPYRQIGVLLLPLTIVLRIAACFLLGAIAVTSVPIVWAIKVCAFVRKSWKGEAVKW